jgi:tetratricopeptide (TPR) repeat protein
MLSLRADAQALKNLAKELKEKKEWMSAIQMYTLAIHALEEKDADCYFSRAYCYQSIELFINATEDLQSACDLRPYP